MRIKILLDGMETLIQSSKTKMVDMIARLPVLKPIKYKIYHLKTDGLFKNNKSNQVQFFYIHIYLIKYNLKPGKKIKEYSIASICLNTFNFIL